jgi:hypothetical protein
MHPFPRLSITQRLKNVGAKGAKTLDIYLFGGKYILFLTSYET